MARRKKSALLQRVEYAAYRVVARLVSAVSDERLLRWGTRFGDLSRRLVPRRDRLAMRNLRAAFPEKSDAELRAILDECWRHFGREMLLFVRSQSMTLEEIAKSCTFNNVEVLDAARAVGNGVLLISAHFGGWEVGGLALMALLDNVRTVARPLDNEYLERDLTRLRARTGAAVIDRRKAARALMKGLSENATIVLLPDQAVQEREGVLVPFLGRDAWTTPAPAKMALRNDSVIVIGFCIPDGARHHLVFDEVIRVGELAEEERDAVALTARINAAIARRIAANPEWWLWMHDRWKGTGKA
jgi:KDO2-lipid IV(A) lauroyltransferase